MVNIISAVIIDDEQSACDILSQLLQRFCPKVKVVDVQNNVEDGVKSIKKHQPNIVFLDIQMPKYAGFEIVNFFPEINFEIIFVTAYDNYAVKAFELSAVDYLLKPIEIDKLKIAVEKLEVKISQQKIQTNYESLVENLKQNELKRLVIPHNGGQTIIELNSIVAIEANEAYSIIHTKLAQFLVSKNLKHFETILSDSSQFFRTHKSWLINFDYISTYNKSKKEILLYDKIIVKLSKLKKANFETKLKTNA